MHCIRGQSLFKSIRGLSRAQTLCDTTTGTGSAGKNKGFSGSVRFATALSCRHLERLVDRETYILHQDEVLCGQLKELTGKQISSEIVDLFLEVARREEFWLDLTTPRLYSLLLNHGPFQKIDIDINSIVTFAKLISRIVDFKSRFTATHSSGVARCSMLLAEAAGMSNWR